MCWYRKYEITMNIIDNDFAELDVDIFNVLKKMFEEKFPDAVESYIMTAKEKVRAIMLATEKGDASGLEHAAHALKGASGQFGALLLSELARKMEVFGRCNEVDKAKEIIQDVIDARISVEKLMLKELG